MTKQDRLTVENQIKNICDYFKIEWNEIINKILFYFLEKSDEYGYYSLSEIDLFNLFKFINKHFITENIEILTKNDIIKINYDFDSELKYYTMNYDYLIKELDLL